MRNTLWIATVSEPYEPPWARLVSDDLETAKEEIIKVIENRLGDEFEHGGWSEYSDGERHMASTRKECAKVERIDFYKGESE